VTRLAVDSIFMMPHLGVLSTVHPEAAKEVFEKDCLVKLGTCIAPVGEGKIGTKCLTVKWTDAQNKENEISLNYGDIKLIPLANGKFKAYIKPERGFDIGAGKGKEIATEIEGGVVGLIIDCRGRRPFTIPTDPKQRIEFLQKTALALNAYPR
ncbi:MAG: glutamate mutase L, partial [candidate division WOR-3 bacterium]|nr:glutamate mutase L [candidate division WOR-3 bacterium]